MGKADWSYSKPTVPQTKEVPRTSFRDARLFLLQAYILFCVVYAVTKTPRVEIALITTIVILVLNRTFNKSIIAAPINLISTVVNVLLDLIAFALLVVFSLFITHYSKYAIFSNDVLGVNELLRMRH